MAAPRAVRIARRPAIVGPAPAPRPATPGGIERPNPAGTARAWRLFGLFAVVLVAIYAAFLAGEARAAGGLGGSPAAPAVFSLLALALAVWGWTITLGRAPRRVRVGATGTVVHERTGRERAFGADPPPTLDVLERYRTSVLSPEPTQLVRLTAAKGRSHLYLVGPSVFDGAVVRTT